LIERFGIQDLIELAPGIAYREALSEMVNSEGLVIFQAANCNEQIPAKLYEYLRTGCPILGLTDPAGDTAWALRRVGIDSIAPLDNSHKIADELMKFIRNIRSGQPQTPNLEAVHNADRKARTSELANLLDAITNSGI
jgi:hypothetical protein